MKDLEKIKSEDLACQVADANPGNFAIEQEVAALVGATVPAPTEPSADDARELGAQLLVFLRRALLPIRSALRTAVAAIYAHLDSRCTDYTPAGYAPFQDPATVPPYDPMRPFVPRTLPNLLQALTAFSARKISNGSAPNDGIPDGVSLGHLICGAYASVTEIKDDNTGWTMPQARLQLLVNAFPNASSIHIGCSKVNGASGALVNSSVVNNLRMPNAEITYFRTTSGYFLLGTHNEVTIELGSINQTRTSNDDLWMFSVIADTLHFYCPTFITEWHTILLYSGAVRVLDMSHTSVFTQRNNGGHMIYLCYTQETADALEVFKLGTLTEGCEYLKFASYYNPANLIDIELGQGSTGNINFGDWAPTLTEANTATFLQNFKDHIALRLTANGSGLTLTLSQAVFSAVIEGSSPICDDIKGIIVEKGWQVQDTNNNIFPTT